MHLDRESPAETPLSECSRRRLLKIAEAIGCSIGDFFDAGTRPPDLAPDLAGAVELIDLWSDIADETGRAKVLACARDAVANGSGGRVARRPTVA